jgi:hypothetical protein
VPTDTYRGAGRPEANFLMERLMDAAADATGLARDEIRRRNVIKPEQFPYRTQMGMLIDSGDFIGNMDMAMKAADWAGFEARRAESAKRGKLRGIGLSNFVEHCLNLRIGTYVAIKPEVRKNMCISDKSRHSISVNDLWSVCWNFDEGSRRNNYLFNRFFLFWFTNRNLSSRSLGIVR